MPVPPSSSAGQDKADLQAGLHFDLRLLRCPATGSPLTLRGSRLVPELPRGEHQTISYEVDDRGIPLFATEFCSPEAAAQRDHYDTVAQAYVTNLGYPHTQEYMAYLDRALHEATGAGPFGVMAEICCGHGEALSLFAHRASAAVGVDISPAMLHVARSKFTAENVALVQGDATCLPLASQAYDTVFMLGGIHHVPDRQALFREIARILKPGGRFYFREPVNDFSPWRMIRAIVYRLSPALDHETESPLRFQDTAPVLADAGLDLRLWKTLGFLGFCLFMNSDVLVFNRLFRYVPGIRTLTRWSARLDEMILALPGMSRNGLQVIGVAEKKSMP